MPQFIKYDDAIAAIFNGNAIPLADRIKQKEMLDKLVGEHCIDVKPVGHGEWIEGLAYEGETTYPGVRIHRCSNCGLRKSKALHWTYCPSCGFIMDGSITDDARIQALRRAVNDMDEMGIDPYTQIADTEDGHDLMQRMMDKHGWVEGWVQYYLHRAKGEK